MWASLTLSPPYALAAQARNRALSAAFYRSRTTGRPLPPVRSGNRRAAHETDSFGCVLVPAVVPGLRNVQVRRRRQEAGRRGAQELSDEMREGRVGQVY